MADSLDDDWYVKEDIAESDVDRVESGNEVSGNESETKFEEDKNTKVTKLSNRKRKTMHESGDSEEQEPSLSKKKKKKKAKKAKGEEEKKLSAESLWTFFEEELKKTLSQLELADVIPEGDWYLQGEADPANDDVSFYLKNAITDWEKKCRITTKEQRNSSPVMLIVCPGAQRAADVLRKTKAFRGTDCKCMKLFAKHLKFSDQMKYLKENIVHLGVGTPNRILKLIDEGGLLINRLHYVIIDWSWKDVKNRQLYNMPGVKEDFLKLFHKYFLTQSTKRKKINLKIGCF